MQHIENFIIAKRSKHSIWKSTQTTWNLLSNW